MQLALFDFDGTITRKDSWMDFLRFAVGPFKFILGAVLLSPVMTGYALGLISNTRLKEIGTKFFLNKWDFSKYRQIAFNYSRSRLPQLIREKALEKISWHKSRGHHVVVVTASFQDWLLDWCNKHQLDLISNVLETKNGYLTGRLKNENCHGAGKVKCITQQLDLSKYSYIYAYGDSSGDRAMFELAHENFYRIF